MDIATAISLMVTGFIKPAVVLLVAALLWFFARKKSAAFQHFILSFGVLAVLCLPLFTSVLPVVEGELAPVLASLSQVPLLWINNVLAEIVASLGPTDLLVLAGVYLLPATWLLFYLLLGVYGLSMVAKKANLVQRESIIDQVAALRELLDIARPVKVMTSTAVDSPQTWGLFRPIIMLPREALLWDDEKQLSVFVHELAHIARWDWLTTLLIKITCACFWFLLPIWWLAQKIYQQAEIACDDYVYKLRDKHLAYAQSLLAIAGDLPGRNESSDALHMRGQSPMYHRILAVLDRQRPHQSVPVEAAQYWLIAGGLLVILFASIQVMPVQIHMQSGVNHRLQWRTEQRDKSFESSATIRTEQFSWELIQQLKPGVQSVPASIETIEQVVIHVPKPDKQELRSNDIVFGGDKAPVMIPSIDIQGFIPLNMATPEYPHQALVKGIEGWVEVVYSIDVDGNIVDPKITAHQPSRIFDRSVLAALKKSHYRPQLLDGQPVIVQGVTEVFRFNLVSHSALDNENQNLVDRDALDRRRR